MAGVRDPAFWRRFSIAVKQDDIEKGQVRALVAAKRVDTAETGKS